MNPYNATWPLANRGVLNQLAAELKYVTGRINQSEWQELIMYAAFQAGLVTVKTKAVALKNLALSTYQTVRRYQRDGIPKAFNADVTRILRLLANLPQAAQQKIAEFTKLTFRQQADEVVTTALTLIIFYAVAGGGDLEGGLPDTDLQLGAGWHRNVFSHSILLGFSVEFCLRFVTAIILEYHDRLPQNHHHLWDEMKKFIEQNSDLAIGALWAGLGAHLLKDANLLGGATKPYTGLPGEHAMGVHQMLFAANGLAAEVFAAQQLTGNPGGQNPHATKSSPKTS